MSLPTLVKYHVYTGQKLPSPWPYDYVLDGAGLLKRVETEHFRAVVRLVYQPVAGLDCYHDVTTSYPRVDLKMPRIPERRLWQVLEHAQKALIGSMVIRPVEQMYHFHWLDSRWQVSVPRQKAGPGTVIYRGGSAASIVLDLHSHHAMNAFFSATDDRDEQGCRFYAVIGQIYNRPVLCLRLGVYGDFVELNPLVLFEGLGPFEGLV